MSKSDFFYVNIRSYLDDDSSVEELNEILEDYECPLNEDVEHFLKHTAVEFARRNQSVSYLVFSTEDGALLGYFTIAIKAITVRIEAISNTVSRKLSRIADYDAETGSYTIPAFLIAQLGKNYADGVNKRIEGSELLEMAWTVIKETQYAVGGIAAFLEAENNNELLNFYSVKNNFRKFDVRETSLSGKELVQLLKLL